MGKYRIVSVDITKKIYGAGPSMEAMVGKVIELNSSGRKRGHFLYGGYSWRYEDTKPFVETKPIPEPALFDPSNIMGG